jgi:hypothetical protein
VPVAVLVEEGRRRSFASALDWPGWARSGPSPQHALDTLGAYRARYGAVLAAAGLAAPTGALTVTETVPGDTTTDFGAPSQIAAADHRVLRRRDRERLASFLVACWEGFDDVVARRGALASGPRGGGRDRPGLARHVAGADVAYARALGLRVAATDGEHAAVVALRARVVAVVLGDLEPDRPGRWPVRYAVRRIAWHACDHRFEAEDRAS